MCKWAVEGVEKCSKQVQKSIDKTKGIVWTLKVRQHEDGEGEGKDSGVQSQRL